MVSFLNQDKDLKRLQSKSVRERILVVKSRLLKLFYRDLAFRQPSGCVFYCLGDFSDVVLPVYMGFFLPSSDRESHHDQSNDNVDNEESVHSLLFSV